MRFGNEKSLRLSFGVAFETVQGGVKWDRIPILPFALRFLLTSSYISSCFLPTPFLPTPWYPTSFFASINAFFFLLLQEKPNPAVCVIYIKCFCGVFQIRVATENLSFLTGKHKQHQQITCSCTDLSWLWFVWLNRTLGVLHSLPLFRQHLLPHITT